MMESDLLIICYSLVQKEAPTWILYDLSDHLRMKGWQVPTYPLPKNLNETIVHRIVVQKILG